MSGEGLQLRRRRIGEVLVERGLLTEEQLEDLLAAQLDPSRPVRPRLGRLVVERGLASEREVAAALAAALGLEVCDLHPGDVDPGTARLLPRGQAERYGTLVLRRDGDIVHVAATDPTNVLALDDIRLRTAARQLQVAVITETQLNDQLARIWSLAEDGAEVGTLLEALDDHSVQEEVDNATDSQVDAAPIVRLVDRLILDAVSQRASDVHVEPALGPSRVRFRIDGLLRDVMTVPKSGHPSLISRLKILSGLDIAERRVPQDGRARFRAGGRDVEARVSTLPSLHGEKVVMRLLARADDVASVDSLGLDAEQRHALSEAMESPQGLILITGPTGSGKTSTLYALLREANKPDVNIVTLEDPIEIAMPGITQVQAHGRAGLTFARGLRSVLRQDPDMVLVGEVRDAETAELALQASMTGHLVLTTLHTNDAVAALTRLVDMGVEPFLVASSLTLVAAQRLVRRPCPDCTRDYHPDARTMTALSLTEDDLLGATPKHGTGCIRCGDTGYRGRQAVYEVLPVTPAIRSVLLATPTEAALGAAARAAGVVSLRTAALAAAARGETTYEEVLRVTTTGQLRSTARARCKACHRRPPDELGDDLVCCPWCGADVDTRGCPTCHRRTSAGWRTCPFCRTRLLRPGDADRQVLVVHNDPGVGHLLADKLSDGAHVNATADADAALRAIAEDAPDVVILDLALPDGAGVDLARVLLTNPDTASLALLLIGTPPEEAAAGLGVAVTGLPSRPAPEALAELVRHTLRRTAPAVVATRGSLPLIEAGAVERK